MKDYELMAKKAGLSIYRSMYDEEGIKKYKINHQSNHVKITYMNGSTTYNELTESTKDELDERQRAYLERLKEIIYPKVEEKMRFNSPIGFLYSINAILNFTLQKWVLGFCWLTSASCYSTIFLRPLKVKRDMELAGWIHDNREDVNKIIQKEVEKKMNKPEFDSETINIPRREYPTDKVPYSKEIYEDGICLNNMDELNNIQLRRLKQKVLRQRKGRR